jgi:polyferredoxin
MSQLATKHANAPFGGADDVEALLTPAHRAALPFSRLLALYLNPFSLFKDASRGSMWMRASALAYNRAKRWMLLIYVRRWLVIATALFLAIAPAEAMAAQSSFFVILAAGFGMGFGVAVVVTVCAAVTYVMLGLQRGPS